VIFRHRRAPAFGFLASDFFRFSAFDLRIFPPPPISRELLVRLRQRRNNNARQNNGRSPQRAHSKRFA
jgi:hypothetical protein